MHISKRRREACERLCKKTRAVTLRSVATDTDKQERPRINGHDRVRVAAHASVDPSSVYRWSRGDRMRSTTARRIALAVTALGLGGQHQS